MRETTEKLPTIRMKSKPVDGKISHQCIVHPQKLFSASFHWTVYYIDTSFSDICSLGCKSLCTLLSLHLKSERRVCMNSQTGSALVMRIQ